MAPPKQRFDDLRGLEPELHRKAANVCLYYGNDREQNSHLRGEFVPDRVPGRLGHVEWSLGYPRIPATLFPAGPGPNGPIVHPGRQGPARFAPRPFALCPELSVSFISGPLAQHFNLTIRPGIVQVFHLPQVALVSQQRGHVSSHHMAYAAIEVECDSGISPAPVPGSEAFSFIVLHGSRFPKDVAIFGRNVLNHMLLLYRAEYRIGLMASASGVGRLYFGRDTRE